MNLYDRARNDNSRILGNGFTVPVVFTDSAGVDCPAEAFFKDVDFNLDANGMPMAGRTIAISVNFISSTGVVQFTSTHKPGKDWRVSFTYNGRTVSGDVLNPMEDRVLGMITMNVQLRRTA